MPHSGELKQYKEKNISQTLLLNINMRSTETGQSLSFNLAIHDYLKQHNVLHGLLIGNRPLNHATYLLPDEGENKNRKYCH